MKYDAATVPVDGAQVAVAVPYVADARARLDDFARQAAKADKSKKKKKVRRKSAKSTAPPPPPVAYNYGYAPPPGVPEYGRDDYAARIERQRYDRDDDYAYGPRGERLRVAQDRGVGPDGCTLAESPIHMPDGRTQMRFVRVCMDDSGRYQVVD